MNWENLRWLIPGIISLAAIVVLIATILVTRDTIRINKEIIEHIERRDTGS